jgi:hypothetical protein
VPDDPAVRQQVVVHSVAEVTVRVELVKHETQLVTLCPNGSQLLPKSSDLRCRWFVDSADCGTRAGLFGWPIRLLGYGGHDELPWSVASQRR